MSDSPNSVEQLTEVARTPWPRVAEEITLERDLRLNRRIGCRYHAQHLSSGGSVELIERAA